MPQLETFESDDVKILQTLPPQQTDRADNNYEKASQEMGLNQQEKYLYKHHLKNLYGSGGVDNPDGSRSTILQMTMENDGKHYNVPSIWEGKALPPEEVGKKIDSVGWNKFPSYGSPEEAEARYEKMHEYMEQDTKKFLSSRAR